MCGVSGSVGHGVEARSHFGSLVVGLMRCFMSARGEVVVRLPHPLPKNGKKKRKEKLIYLGLCVCMCGRK